MEIEMMSRDDIQERLSQIETELKTDGADVDKLSAEVDALQARRSSEGGSRRETCRNGKGCRNDCTCHRHCRT